ncbi:MAG: DUF45 domain-containing protein [Methanoregula sp.]|nr:DUF45 domain-containing protein [Methanoregula sp.]
MTIPVYTIEPSARRRVMTVVVYPSGAVCVRVPLIYDPAEVQRFVLRSAGWIEQQQLIAKSTPEKPQNLSPSREIRGGTGRPRTLGRG